MNEQIAATLLGWKWVSFFSRPVNSHPDYPKIMRVRQFLPMRILSDERWQKYFSDKELQDSSGDEPLDYSYCSSGGNVFMEDWSGSLDACFADVIPAMTGKGYRFSLATNSDGSYAATFWQGNRRVTHKGRKPALEICKAALEILE